MKEATVSEINTEAPKKECSSRLLLSASDITETVAPKRPGIWSDSYPIHSHHVIVNVSERQIHPRG
ncbi:hypothetical protein YC2023_032531 [Brassica napus]